MRVDVAEGDGEGADIDPGTSSNELPKATVPPTVAIAATVPFKKSLLVSIFVMNVQET